MKLLPKIRSMVTAPLYIGYCIKCSLFGYDYNTGRKVGKQAKSKPNNKEK